MIHCSAMTDPLTCSICFNKFNEDTRCPKILPCGHTFCFDCILKLAVRGLWCPVDRQAVSSVVTLPKNFALLDVLRRQTEQKRQAKLHTMVDGSTLEPKMNCPEHPRQTCWCYDTVCKKLICIDCYASKHVGHSCQSLGEAAASARREIPGLAEQAAKIAEDLDTSRNHMVAIQVDVTSVTQQQIHKLDAAFAEIREVLAMRQSLLKDELCLKVAKQREALKQQESTLHDLSCQMRDMVKRSREIGHLENSLVIQSRLALESLLDQHSSTASNLHCPWKATEVSFAWARDELLAAFAEVGVVGDESDAFPSSVPLLPTPTRSVRASTRRLKRHRKWHPLARRRARQEKEAEEAIDLDEFGTEMYFSTIAADVERRGREYTWPTKRLFRFEGDPTILLARIGFPPLKVFVELTVLDVFASLFVCWWLGPIWFIIAATCGLLERRPTDQTCGSSSSQPECTWRTKKWFRLEGTVLPSSWRILLARVGLPRLEMVVELTALDVFASLFSYLLVGPIFLIWPLITWRSPDPVEMLIDVSVGLYLMLPHLVEWGAWALAVERLDML